MAVDDVATYATVLRDVLGAGADPVLASALDELVAAGNALDAAIAGGGDVTGAADTWKLRFSAVADHLPAYLLGVLADVPGLAELVADVDDVVTEGRPRQRRPRTGAPRGRVRDARGPAADVGGVTARRPAGRPVPGRRDRGLARRSVRGWRTARRRVDRPAARRRRATAARSQLPLGPVQVSAAAVLATIDGQPVVPGHPRRHLPAAGPAVVRLLAGPRRRHRRRQPAGRHRRAAGGRPHRGRRRRALRRPARRRRRSPWSRAADRLFPGHLGTHLVGPSLRVSWLSFGPPGSLLVARPRRHRRDPDRQGGDPRRRAGEHPGSAARAQPAPRPAGHHRPGRAARVDRRQPRRQPRPRHLRGLRRRRDALQLGHPTATWWSSVGGFFPGFNPEPAQHPGAAPGRPGARHSRCRSSTSAPRATSRSPRTRVQFGGRLEVGISLGIEAHGFVQVDAIVQFRPFQFEAQRVGRVRRLGRRFQLRLGDARRGRSPAPARSSSTARSASTSSCSRSPGTRRSRSAAGPADSLPTPPRLLDVLAAELGQARERARRRASATPTSC